MSRSTAQRLRLWLVPAAIVLVAGALIAVVLLQSRGGSDGANPAPSAQSTDGSRPAEDAGSGGKEDAGGDAAKQPVDLTFLEARQESDVQTAGPVDAPVGLVVFSDYQCQYCAKWTRDTLPVMLQYAKTGDLRIEWRDANVYGPDSERAARAAYAAGLQGKYWEYHDALFADGTHRSKDQLSRDALTAVATDLGLDTARFTRDLDADETRQRVQYYAGVAQQIGVSGTPTFILGGEPLVGAQPTEVFESTLRDKLREAHE